MKNKNTSIGTVPKYLYRNGSKIPLSERFQNTSIGTVPKSNTTIVERGKIDTSISNVQNLLHVHLPEKFGSMRI